MKRRLYVCRNCEDGSDLSAVVTYQQVHDNPRFYLGALNPDLWIMPICAKCGNRIDIPRMEAGSVCRYCHKLDYPIPKEGFTLTRDDWNGEWAHFACAKQAREAVNQIVMNFMSQIRQASITRRSRQK